MTTLTNAMRDAAESLHAVPPGHLVTVADAAQFLREAADTIDTLQQRLTVLEGIVSEFLAAEEQNEPITAEWAAFLDASRQALSYMEGTRE